MRRAHVFFSMVATLGVAMLFWFIHYYGQAELQTHFDLDDRLDALSKLEQDLEYEVLRVELSHYPNFDLVNSLLHERQEVIETLFDFADQGMGGHEQTMNAVRKMLALYEQDQLILEDWKTYHSMLRNSTIYIPTLSQRLLLEHRGSGHDQLVERLLRFASAISLSSGTYSLNNLNQVQSELNWLQGFNARQRTSLYSLQTLLSHGKIFVDNYPRYLSLRENIHQLKRLKELQTEEIMNVFLIEDGEELDFLVFLSYGIFAFIMIAEVMILFFIFKSEKASITDPLTGLPNRYAFERDAEHCPHPGFLLLNIKQFNKVNNVFGIEVGDEILRRVAKRLKVGLNEGNAKLYRLGGDEFGVLYENLHHEEELKAYSEMVIRLVETKPFEHEKLPIHLELHVAGTCAGPFLEKANMVMSRLDGQPSAKYLIYTDGLSLENEVLQNYRMLQELRAAVEEDRIEPHFQPIVNTATGKVEKYECLVRLKRKDGSLLYPAEFLELAKEANLYQRITREMVRKSFERFHDEEVQFSINLSSLDISDGYLSHWILNILSSNKELASRATFELLESEGIENFDLVRSFIAEAQGYGAKFAIDDFGSGYSNYENILQLKVDYLKIDGSLIRRIDVDLDSERITKSIINFAHDIGIQVIVEFVHSEAVLAKAKELGTDFAQGYYLGMPQANF